MEKKTFLFEELFRIRQIMSNMDYLMEATTTPPKNYRGFDINLNPAVSQQVKNDIETWANTTLGLTKNGNRVTYDDLLDYGKSKTRFGNTTNDAEAIWNVAAQAGRENFKSLIEKIHKTQKAEIKNLYDTKIATARTRIQNSYKKTLDDADIDLTRDINLIDTKLTNLKYAKNSIEGYARDFPEKSFLVDALQKKIDLYESAVQQSYSSRADKLPDDIGTTSSGPNPGGGGPNPGGGSATRSAVEIEIDNKLNEPMFRNLPENEKLTIKNHILNREKSTGRTNYTKEDLKAVELEVEEAAKKIKQQLKDLEQEAKDTRDINKAERVKKAKNTIKGGLGIIGKVLGFCKRFGTSGTGKAAMVAGCNIAIPIISISIFNAVQYAYDEEEDIIKWQTSICYLDAIFQIKSEFCQKYSQSKGGYQNTSEDFQKWLNANSWEAAPFKGNRAELVYDNSSADGVYYEYKDGTWNKTE